MLPKTKKLQQLPLLSWISDVRMLGLVVFTILALLVTWSGIKVVQTNYELQKQMSAMQQKNEVSKLKNSNLALKNQYYETDQYLELAARRQYNKGLPGEKLLIVPKSVALAHTVEVKIPQPEVKNASALENEGPWYESNFNAWLEFLFRREG
jgi:cell division protein FtsB